MVFSDWLGSLSQTALLASSTSFKPGTELFVLCMRFKAYATQVWDSESRIAFALPQPKTTERRCHPERGRFLSRSRYLGWLHYFLAALNCITGGKAIDKTIPSDEFGSQSVTLLAVRPHPDDESTSTGGMLAYYSARDVRTGVVICTGGEEGEIHDPDLDPVADKSRLREIRTQEVKDACAILGVAELRMLGYRDSGMAGTPANQHPEAFVNAERVEAAGKLVRIIRELRPSVIVTEPPGGMYPHPDHVMCHEISVDAFQAAGDAEAFPEAGPPWRPGKLYGVAQIDDGGWEKLVPKFIAAGFDMDWMERRPRRSRGPGPETATVALNVRPYSEHQRRALLAHRTQIPPESFLVSLPPELRLLAFATAYFFRLSPPCHLGEHEPDLLDGLD